MPRTIIRKVNVNKRTKQFTATIPKKKLRKDLRFGKNLFVKLEVFEKEKN